MILDQWALQVSSEEDLKVQALEVGQRVIFLLLPPLQEWIFVVHPNTNYV